MLDRDVKEILKNLGDVGGAFRDKRVLITGAGGFLGRYLLDVLTRLDARVLGLDNWKTSERQHELITCDVTSGKIPRFEYAFGEEGARVGERLPGEKPYDYILHLAGIASPHYYRKFPLETLEVATTGLKNVLEMARQDGARLLFFSSSEVYGDPDAQNVPTKESYNGNVSTMGPRSCYDISKKLGETLCHIYHDHFGVETLIVRPFNVYGPGMSQKDYRVLPNFASKMLKGEAIEIYGSGQQTRTFCYVTDAINGFLRVLAQGEAGEAYNIGNPFPELTMDELARRLQMMFRRVSGFSIKNVPHPSTYPADEPQRRCPDIQKAREGVGFEPHVNLADGLGRFFDWTKTAYT